MLAILLSLALQAAPATSPQPERWSILVPVADEPCRPTRKDDTPGEVPGKGDVVVCGAPLPSQRLAHPEEVVPAGPRPSNSALSGAQALAVQASPCATRQGGCPGVFGPPIVPLVKGAVGALKSALKKRPDTSNRIPIPLDDLPPDAPATVMEKPSR